MLWYYYIIIIGIILLLILIIHSGCCAQTCVEVPVDRIVEREKVRAVSHEVGKGPQTTAKGPKYFCLVA